MTGETSPPATPLTVEERLAHGDARMSKIETALAENTAATKEVLEIVRMGKSLFKLAGYTGDFIKWLAALAIAVVALYKLWKSGGAS